MGETLNYSAFAVSRYGRHWKVVTVFAFSFPVAVNLALTLCWFEAWYTFGRNPQFGDPFLKLTTTGLLAWVAGLLGGVPVFIVGYLGILVSTERVGVLSRFICFVSYFFLWGGCFWFFVHDPLRLLGWLLD